MTGPLMIDVQGTSLTAEDKELLQHPLVGGLILFTRNYENKAQLVELTHSIQQAAKQPILLAVDHEGGRVQRFRQSFSAIPAMAQLWDGSASSLKEAQQQAFHFGHLMASEVIDVGIDLSFAPVLDVNGVSDVIGDRAFHSDPHKISLIAEYFINGMHDAGMKTTGKHFPGHGSVKADSHIALPIDERPEQQIYTHDMLPFEQMIANNKLDAIMPAHVIYPKVDKHAVGFSRFWLQQILREKLKFNGVIFSDDLSMEGATYIGAFPERAEAAQSAGCDMMLVCNNRAASIDIIDHANISVNKISSQRLQKLYVNR